MGEAMNRPSPRVPVRHTRGLKGLAADFASTLAVERVRVAHPEARGMAFSGLVAANIPEHLQADLKAGMQAALEAVGSIRAAPDYDPSVHGSTDDEIAAWLQDRAEEHRARRKGS